VDSFSNVKEKTVSVIIVSDLELILWGETRIFPPKQCMEWVPEKRYKASGGLSCSKNKKIGGFLGQKIFFLYPPREKNFSVFIIKRLQIGRGSIESGPVLPGWEKS